MMRVIFVIKIIDFLVKNAVLNVNILNFFLYLTR